jgi:hypothetical protein
MAPSTAKPKERKKSSARRRRRRTSIRCQKISYSGSKIQIV